MRICKFLTTIVSVTGLVAAGAATAGPYTTKSGISASAQDATVAGNNPAGMTRFDERAMRGGIFGFFSDSTFEGTSSGTGMDFISESDSTTVIPSFNVVQPFGDNYWFGFTVLGTGFSDDFGEDWGGRYLIQDYSLAYISAFPSIATKLTDRLSVAGSLALTYTVFEQNKAVLNVDPGFEDGSLNLDADGWAVGWSVSMLYEYTDRTRFGAVYRSEIDPDMDAELNFSGLGPTTESILDAAGLLNASASMSSTSPAAFNIGMFHEFENGHQFTFDLVWINFSEFTLTELYIDGGSLLDTDPIYEDITGVSVAWNFPINDRWRFGLGAFTTSDMIEDTNRSMLLRLDYATSYGIGVEYTGNNDRIYTLNLSYLDLGEAPVESPDLPLLGVITGEYTTRDTLYLEFGMAFGGRPR